MLASQTSLPTRGRSRKEGEGGGTFAVNSTQDMPACAMEIPWVPTRNIYLWRKAIKKVFFQFYGSNTQVEILADLNFFYMAITLQTLILYTVTKLVDIVQRCRGEVYISGAYIVAQFQPL